MSRWSFVQSLIDAQETAFVLIDAGYRIVAANRAYRERYGIQSDHQVVGRRCHEVSHHLEEPCHKRGEDCPHRQVFQTGTAHQVLHTHYDHQGRAEHVRIKGHVIDGPDGERYLGEAIFPLAAVQDVDCEEMRLIGRSPAFLHAMERLSQAAASNANVLLLGESGVGKELAARYVHDHSPRAGRDFLALDCASINETLFESEVFGHERGAFTGCIGRKQGLFELADGGTLFLDEIGEVPLGMQAKLLRVLESGEFRRVGGREILRADVRVVAATNRDLRQMMREGRFREDLYYRLACITVPLPSLRERRSDIPALAEALLARLTAGSGQRCYLTGEALARLSSYDFPGNVRELRNMLQRAVVLARHGAITAQDLDLPDTAVPPLAAQAGPAAPSVKSLRDLEFQMVRDLLARFDGNRRQVAEALGVSERTVYRKLRQYGLLRRE